MILEETFFHSDNNASSNLHFTEPLGSPSYDQEAWALFSSLDLSHYPWNKARFLGLNLIASSDSGAKPELKAHTSIASHLSVSCHGVLHFYS